MLKKINLKNKIALVTGAGKGLGRACSIALAEAGATVVALSRTSSDLNKLEKEIKKEERLKRREQLKQSILEEKDKSSQEELYKRLSEFEINQTKKN